MPETSNLQRNTEDKPKEGKVALVTGSSRGIGAACALALGQQGYTVAIHYRSNQEQAEAICSQIPNSAAFAFDLSKTQDCQDLIKAVKDRFGRIDVLVNNAGISIDQLIAFAKPEDFDQLVATNLKSVFLLTKFASRHMIKQKSGSIINMTSVVGHTGNAGQSMYAATKSAITGFTQSIAMDLAGFGIRCNCVAPGFIDTEMTGALNDEVRKEILKKIPLGRLGTPKEVAKAVAFLASDSSSYITGSTLHVNGGMYTQ
jgi:3-oxoacyl-[acyl-carrier protein] reductase